MVMGLPESLGALVITLWVLQFMKLFWLHRRFPPGPVPLPLIGSLWRVGWKIHQDLLLKLASTYGNVFTIWIGHFPVVVMSGFQTVKAGLTSHMEALCSRPATSLFKALGNEQGILFANGKSWKEQKHFGHATLQKLLYETKDLEGQIKKEARQLVETFAREKGQPLDPSVALMHSASQVISALAFGHPFSVEDKAFLELVEHIGNATNVGGTTGDMMYEILPSLMKHVSERHKKVFSAYEFMRSFIKKEIESHKKSNRAQDPKDFIDFYLAQINKEKTDSTSTFDEDNLVQVIADFFVAGAAPVAATLSWALLYMAAHPEVQEKVKKELASALDSSGSICYEDRTKLPYTNAVIHEVQRLSNVMLFALPRLSVQDMYVHGHFIPKNTLVISDLCSVLLDPKQWETPRQFNLNHFLDKDGNFRAREEFFPFGKGCRACLGEQLAQTELFVFFTCLLREFAFRLPDEVKEVNMEPVTSTVAHPHPYKLCAEASKVQHSHEQGKECD